VNRANLEQRTAADQIAFSMEEATEKFKVISEQTAILRQDSRQIVSAMHTIDVTTENILHNAIDISGETIKNLIQQSDILQKIVTVFKIA